MGPLGAAAAGDADGLGTACVDEVVAHILLLISNHISIATHIQEAF